MTCYIGKRKYTVKGMDIESHNDDESIALNETSMWLGCYLDENSRPEDSRSYFYNMTDFLSRLEEDTRPTRAKNKAKVKNNIACYIYNLAFEFSFLLPELIRAGFKWKATVEANDEFVFNSVSTKTCSSVWEVTMKFGKKNGFVRLRDLSKVFPGGLATVAKSFGLETQKGEIDYTLNRRHGHIVTEEEKIYCFKDTRIIIEILLKMQEKGDKDFFQSISAASYSMRKLLNQTFTRVRKPYQAFRRQYPELDKRESDFLRKTVEGGICYAPTDYQFKDLQFPIGHIDKHQMHPSSAYFNLFPYGKGEYFTGRPPAGKICAVRCLISYDFVRLHSKVKLIGCPFITDKEIILWDFELPTMFKCYGNFRIKYIDGYAYNMKRLAWKNYYANNYKRRRAAKLSGDLFGNMYYKLLNNSSYGKLLEKSHTVQYRNIVNADGLIDSEIEYITPKPGEEPTENAKYTYLPVGSAIPAYSRVDLIETALKFGWKNILYFDTDSIFFKWTNETRRVWESLNQEDFLGGWGWEEMIDRAQFATPKRYKTISEGKTTVKAGGINFKKYRLDNGLSEKDNLPFDEINITSSAWQVQRAYHAKGGTLIKFQKKEMKVPKKYAETYTANCPL